MSPVPRPALVSAVAVLAVASIAWWWMGGRPVDVVDAPGGRVACVSYAPFRDGQSPFDETLVVPPEQIEADLRRLKARVDCVRTYATDQGLDAVPAIAERLGMTVLLGAWIGREDKGNRRQFERAVALANAHPGTVRAVIVGNEVLLRGELPAAELARLIRAARAATRVPVTYADVWEFWLKNPEVAAATDFVTIHILPYWEDDPIGIDHAVAHVVDIYRRVRASFEGRTIFLGETGWPSRGRMREAALPGRVNQARFVRGFLAAAKREGIDFNLVEAFDQPWKRWLEGTVGGSWGLFSGGREPKFPLLGAVEEDPAWRLHLTLSLAIGLAGAAAAGWTRRRRGRVGWVFLVFAGVAAGGALVQYGLMVLAASVGTLDWVAGGAAWAMAAAVAWHAAAALAAGLEPGVATRGPLAVADAVVRWRQARPEAALGLLRFGALFGAAAVCLTLVFDSRYRDFPVAAFLVPAVAFALLRLRAGTEAGPEERILGWTLAVAAAGVVVNEGIDNTRALAWAATALLLAVPVLGARRPAVEAGEAHQAEQKADGAEVGVVEDQRGAAQRHRRP